GRLRGQRPEAGSLQVRSEEAKRLRRSRSGTRIAHERTRLRHLGATPPRDVIGERHCVTLGVRQCLCMCTSGSEHICRDGSAYLGGCSCPTRSITTAWWPSLSTP